MIIDKLGAAKRFGARYGSTLKYKLAKIEKETRKKNKCPYCNKIKVKRISSGIWLCRGCNTKFASRAYYVAKKAVIRGQVEDLEKEKIKEELEK